MKVSMILATDNKGAIGNNDMLLIRSDYDMQRFRKVTKNKCLIMGRKTFDSLGSPLKKRFHIIITRNRELLNNCEITLNEHAHGNFKDNPVLYVGSMDAALTMADELSKHESWPYDSNESVVIGGAQIYNQCINEHIVDTIYLTIFEYNIKEYDTIIDISVFDQSGHPLPEMCQIMETGQSEVINVYFYEYKLGYYQV